MKTLKRFKTLSIIFGLVALLSTPAVYLLAQPLVPYAPAGLTLLGVYSQSLTPAASSAAIQTAEQTFTVAGLTTNDLVHVIGPAPTSLCPMVAARVSTANTLAISFSTLTASACTPAAGVYRVIAFRLGG